MTTTPAFLHGLPPFDQPLNAAGTFTPVGVSRASPAVAEATAWALQRFLVIDEWQDLASRELAAFSGAAAGTVVHCAAAGITLCVAAAMAGTDPRRIAQLPDSEGLRRAVVVPAPHLIDYGHPLATDIRLAGGTVRACGQPERCTADDWLPALAAPEVGCLLLVSSRLTRDPAFDFAAATEAARAAGVPVVIDGAAQDLRVRELVALQPAAVVLSAQKYLAAPTAGLVVGEAGFIEAVRAQQKGIGRAMKPSKEALVGVLAALHERRALDLGAWSRQQEAKVRQAVDALGGLPGVQAMRMPDPLGAPVPRVRLRFAGGAEAARAAAQALRRQDPPVWVMEHGVAEGVLTLELIALRADEVDALTGALRRCLA
ncbi:hypothetical protein JNX00_21305 [Hydrogenophaga sp. YM1]|uniref:hypothetical protein n=1 Tax=Hydrogenophaga sp. YM1 TaxID=2806262 RepID=UPI00195E0567|nr:hypothetical protein [Hydrogenophaga sp. YM1]QRR34135.1 hypothetical protein JNX00_21305 [Hydrogenophaga sp. YM1]